MHCYYCRYYHYYRYDYYYRYYYYYSPSPAITNTALLRAKDLKTTKKQIYIYLMVAPIYRRGNFREHGAHIKFFLLRLIA